MPVATAAPASPMPSPVLAPAAPCTGAAPTPGQELARTQWAQSDAREQWLAARHGKYAPGGRARLAAAKAAYQQAREAFAAAARAFWASPEGHTYAAAQRAAGYLNH
ncbi:hypothetical protein HHL22_11945 [Hymenobacter sp. RP-2-7]|uniref:Uncharacterized protein n=1 Tax=Hymenobacter polaris TaxID=2682546 RepID=A0A7Y0AEK0_9BACT|nr:hypothetical protein [Hymenobacter polaris]NML65918.1 hypothetical protein [Hymenobacter polaris]